MSRYIPYLVLMGGVLVAATAAVVVRFGQGEGMPSLLIAMWRLLMASLILTPIAWHSRSAELTRLTWRQIGLGMLAGVFLSVHLASWILSLEYTSVASSTAFVTTSPLWIALIVYFIYGERLSRYTVMGLFAAMAGSILVGLSDGGIVTARLFPLPSVTFAWENLTPDDVGQLALLGNGLALLGAMVMAGYLLIGRNLRRDLSNVSYIWVVYSAAAITLLLVSLISGTSPLGYSWAAYGWVLLLALGPQLLGHTSFNWALAHLSSTLVGIVTLGEPIGAAIFAYILLSESFALVQLVGFVVLLTGIGLAIAGEQHKEKTKASEAVAQSEVKVS